MHTRLGPYLVALVAISLNRGVAWCWNKLVQQYRTLYEVTSNRNFTFVRAFVLLCIAMSLMLFFGVVGTVSLPMAQPAQVEPRTATAYEATWESLDTVRPQACVVADTGGCDRR